VRRADDCARPNQTDQIFKWSPLKKKIFKWSRVPAQSMPPMAWPRLWLRPGPPLPRSQTCPAPAAHIIVVVCHAPPAWALQSARRVVAPMLSHWISKVKVTTYYP